MSVNDDLPWISPALALIREAVRADLPVLGHCLGGQLMAKALGGSPLVDLIVEGTHTCYLGDRSQRHPWGYGCGTCPACELRANGWTQWRSTTAPAPKS